MNGVKTLTIHQAVRLMVFDGSITKMDLAEKLGISRVTLDARLEKGNWKKSELHLLKSIV